MKLFIAGATSVLGKKTIELLLKDGHEIHALTRSKGKAKELKKLGITPVVGNIYDKDFLLEQTKGFKGFINLATAVPKKFNTKAKDWKDNNKLRIEAVKIIVNVVKTNKIHFYIQNTSLLAYGHRGGKWVDERVKWTHPPQLYYELDQEYIDILESSLRCEYILNHVYEGHLPFIILRFGMIYGPKTFHTQELLEQVNKNVYPIVLEGASYMNMIHIDDAASAVVQAIKNYKKIRRETFNILDDEPVTNEDFVKYLSKKLNDKEPKKADLKISDMLLSRFSVNIILSSFRSKNDKFKEMTGWKPKFKTYKEGYSSVINELKLEGKL